jgi:hypothetical protein
MSGCSFALRNSTLTPETLLEGIVPLRVAAAAIGRSPFTLKRWCDKPGGPPLIYLGRFPHLDLLKLRKWIISQERVVTDPPARRGRPRKVAQ